MWSEDKVRIIDIAEELGVSTATVSNVIHGKSRRVSAATTARVQQALEDRGYVPNMAATLLSQNDSRIIGVVVKDHPKYEGHIFEDPFIAAAVNALSDEIEKSGNFMMVKKATEILEIVRFASMWNLDGMVILCFCEDEYQALRDRIRIPFVVYDGFFTAPRRIASLRIDDFDGGKQVGVHFKAEGYEHALFVADNHICMDLDRYRGFCEGFGKTADYLEIPLRREERLPFYEKRIEEFHAHDAVFAASDFYAAELLHFLTEHGFSVPGDIAVAGFDDGAICKQTTPPLTSVRQNPFLRAKKAVALLAEMKQTPEFSKEEILPVELIVRESTRRH